MKYILLVALLIGLASCQSDIDKANKIKVDLEQCVKDSGVPGLLTVNGSSVVVCYK